MHVEPPLIPLIKSNNYEKSDKDFVKIKFCRDLMSETSDLYELKMFFLITAILRVFSLFVRNLNMTLESSGMLKSCAKVQ